MLADAGYICYIILEGGYRALDLQSKGPEFEGVIYMYMYVAKYGPFSVGIKTVARMEID